MIIDIVNPSDPYTFIAPDAEIAAIVICLLGKGQYEGIDTDTKSTVVPFFMLLDHDAWFHEKFRCTFEESLTRCMSSRKQELIDSLNSVLIGDIHQRGGYAEQLKKVLLEDVAQFRAEWHDTLRSSSNDIGARAWGYANILAKKNADEQNA